MQEIIDIVIRDKVDASISANLAKIGTSAQDADGKIVSLSKNLASVGSSTAGFDSLQRAAAAAADAINKAAVAATASTRAAQMINAANANAALSAQKLATEQAKTAAAVSKSEAASSNAAAAQLRLEAAQRKASDAALKQANAATAAAVAAAKQAQDLDKATNAANKHEKAMGGSTRGMSLWTKAASAIGAAVGVKEILGMADAYTTMQNKLQNVSTSQEQVNELTGRLFNLANETRSSVESTTTAFTRFDRSLKQMGKSQEDTLRMTETVNKALIVSGATSSEASSSLLQLSQAFNAGKLSGDEFRAVSENMPVVLDAVAKTLGKPINEVKQLASDGKITAKVMFDAFKSIEKSIDETFSKTNATVGQALTVATNRFTQFIGEIDKSLGVTRAIANAIDVVSKNLGALAVVAATVGVAMLVVFGPAIVSAISAATMAVVGFTAALMANPIGLIAVGLTAVISALIVFGDKIDAGTKGLATLKDIGTATMEAITSTFSDFFSSISKGWSSMFEDGYEVMNGLDHSSFVLSKNANANFSSIFNNGYTGWTRFAMAGARAMDTIVGAAITMTRTVGNLFTMIFDRAAAVGEALKNLTSGPQAMANAYNARMDKSKFKSTEDAFRGAFQSAVDTVSTRGFESKLTTIFARADQIAQKRENDNKKKTSNLRGTGENTLGSGEGTDKKAQKAAENRVKALTLVNMKLDDEIARMNMLAPLREQEAKFDQIKEQLAQKGITLSQSEEVAIRSKIKAIQDGTKVQAEMDRMYQEAVGPMEAYNNGLAAAEKLLKMGAISRDEYNKQVLKSSEAYKNAIDPMRQEMQALKDQGALLGYLPKQREIESKIMEVVNAKRREGIELTRETIDAYRQELLVLQQKNAIDAEQSALLANSVDAREKYINQLKAIKELQVNPSSGFTAGDAAGATAGMLGGMGLDTTGMNVQNEADMAMYQQHYDQLEMLRQNDLIKEQDYANAKAQIAEKEFRLRTQKAANFFGELSTLQSSSVKELALIGKTAAITEALVNTHVAATKAWAQGGIYGAAMAAVVVAKGMAEVAAIRSAGYASGGYTGDIPRTQEAGVVHGQEFVMNAAATSRIGQEDLYALQNGTASIQRNNEQAGSTGKLSASNTNAGSNNGSGNVITSPAVNLKVVNTLDPAMVGDYLATSDGEQVLVNTIRRNGDAIKSAIN